ncbi:thioredoxin TrxC [Thiococcus pfennigii]|uniref:thioredoxin TrxC n=1 Tax=Thiococcus pfennigii TaxID=1057 RepID=UPI001906E3EA|nr:thioredoxin TrxC [Thiococcus pfennigii]MBK1732082.1 thiol reductase thioredoxin [Thiococcus pfennigii]
MSESVHVVCPHCDAVNRVPRARLAAGAKCGRCHAPLFAGTPVALDERRFATHLGRSDLPLVVDFWAPWCAPCRMMAPIFEEAARTLEPGARLVKVDTEQAQGLAMQFAIRSIPTLAVFRGGREVARTAGAMDLASLLAWVRQHL